MSHPDANEELPGPEPEFVVTRPTAAGEVRVRVWPARWGSARSPVLFCCHAWTESGAAFGPLAAALGRRWTLVAPDAPGHGGTPWERDARYRVPDHARTALAVLDQFPEVAGRRAGIVLLGHGLGALTAARLAAARPGVVRHLVLEEPARSALRRTPSAARMRTRVATLQSLDRDGLLAAGRDEAARAGAPGWPDDELGPWADGLATASLAALSVPVSWGEPLGALLADVPQPVTLVHGSLSRGGTVAAVTARRCAAVCRSGGETVRLDAGGSPRREARTPFATVLGAVLGRYEEL